MMFTITTLNLEGDNKHTPPHITESGSGTHEPLFFSFKELKPLTDFSNQDMSGQLPPTNFNKLKNFNQFLLPFFHNHISKNIRDHLYC